MSKYHLSVPKELQANLEFRLKIRERAAKEPAFRAAMMKACQEDPLFFFNVFCWLVEPRPRRGKSGKVLPTKIPFITWPHQDKAAEEQIIPNLGFKDIGVEKSRGEGMSWLALYLAVWEFVFNPYSFIGCVSSTKDKGDNPKDPGSLGWKIDFAIANLPKWMSPSMTRTLSESAWTNLDNASTITIFAATADVARGGRVKWFLMDEIAAEEWKSGGKDELAMTSTQAVTDCRLFVSTPNGSDGAYYRMMHSDSSMVKVVLSWRDNPTRNKGMYRMVKGVPTAIDPANPLPPEYDPPNQETLARFSVLRGRGFDLEKGIRSPWLDDQCMRPDSTPQSISKEYEMDYGGAMYKFFSSDFFQVTDDTVRAPFHIGDISYNSETLDATFDTVSNGPVKLWCAMDHLGNPPPSSYVMGVDVCYGYGGSFSSNSSCEVFDSFSGNQVLEFAQNTIKPEDFADLCIAIAKWFYGAFMVWEHAGPGIGFATKIMHRKYTNFYYRDQEWKRGRNRANKKQPGWIPNENTKNQVFTQFRDAVKTGKILLRSNTLVKECDQYVLIDRKIVHVLDARSNDDATTGKAHGDRAIAACLAYHGMAQRPPPSRDLSDHLLKNPPPMTMAYRMQQWEESQKKDDDENIWDDRETSDMKRPR